METDWAEKRAREMLRDVGISCECTCNIVFMQRKREDPTCTFHSYAKYLFPEIAAALLEARQNCNCQELKQMIKDANEGIVKTMAALNAPKGENNE